MDINVHDLLRIGHSSELRSEYPIPAWVHESIARTKWVVKRRNDIKEGLVPIGVRGKFRHERFAACIPFSSIEEIRTPVELVDLANRRMASRKESIPVFAVLEDIDSYYRELGIRWGPTGSLGYELASGYPAAHFDSDLDIAIYAQQPVEYKTAALWSRFHQKLSVRIDALLETPMGACSLTEFINSTDRLLLRTKKGPRMVSCPWNPKT